MREIARTWIRDFGAALESDRLQDLDGLFAVDGWWRDLLTFSWDFRTLRGADDMRTVIGPALARVRPRRFQMPGTSEPTSTVVNGRSNVLAFFDFETTDAVGRGYVRLREASGEGGSPWKAWILFTQMDGLRSFPERMGIERPARNRPRAAHERTDAFDAVIVGAGQCGLSTAARLGQLGLSTLVLERNRRVGDNWRQRYPSLALHDPVWANHLPYLPFPATWPVYPTRDKVADWLEAYASVMDLDVSTETVLQSCHYDDDSHRWSIEVSTAGEQRSMTSAHLVLAIGREGEPRPPAFQGLDTFAGEVMHSGSYLGGAEFRGLSAVVVGGGTSAHDIAEDLSKYCSEVTMVQRSSTFVMSSQQHEWMLSKVYAEDGPPTEDADMMEAAVPLRLASSWYVEQTQHMAESDHELLESMKARGYKYDHGPNGAGLYAKRLAGLDGYYIDVGAGELIAQGKIKIKQGQGVAHFERNCVVFEDGDTARADLVVLATGYRPLVDVIGDVVGTPALARCRCPFVLNAEGEIQGLWRQTGHPGLWLAAGNLRQARYFSRFLALQIKGMEEGLVPKDHLP